MGIAERKEREKFEKRQRILDAATKMFLEDGYEKTSLRNIAEKIEFSPATIYLYFKDKDQLLYEIQKQAFGQLNEVFIKEVTAENPLERLRQICISYVEYGWKNPGMYDLMFIIRAPMNVVECHDGWDNATASFNVLAHCLQQCIEQQLIRYTDVMIAALSVWAMGHGLVSLNIRCRYKIMPMNDDEIQQAIHSSIEEFLRMITE